MARTLLDQVRDLAGSDIDAGAALAALDNSAALTIRILPENALTPYGTTSPVPVTGLNVRRNRVLGLTVSGRPAIPIPPTMSGLAVDEASIHYAGDLSPRYWIVAGIVRSHPAPGVAYLVPYPTILDTDTTIATLPEYSIPVIVTQASLMMAIGLLRDYMSTTSSGSGFPVAPTPPADSTLPVGFTFEITGLPTLLDLSNNYSQLATVLDTEEDLEAAMTKLSEMKTRLEEWITEINGTLQTAVERWKASIENQKIPFDARLQRYEAEIRAYAAELTARSAYIRSASDKVQELRALFTLQYQIMMQQASAAAMVGGQRGEGQ